MCKGTRNMTEMELNLLLLRFNMLSKERAEASYKWRLTGIRDSKWSKYEDEAREMMKELSEYGYAFTYVGSKKAGEVKYSVYKLTKTATAGWVGIA